MFGESNAQLREQIRVQRAMLDEAVRERMAAEERAVELAGELDELRQTLDTAMRGQIELRAQLAACDVVFGIEAMPVNKSEILQTLAVVNAKTPLWRAVLAIAEGQRRDDQAAVCEPAISSEVAHYRRGRLAAIEDFRNTLLTLHEEALTPKELAA